MDTASYCLPSFARPFEVCCLDLRCQHIMTATVSLQPQVFKYEGRCYPAVHYSAVAYCPCGWSVSAGLRAIRLGPLD